MGDLVRYDAMCRAIDAAYDVDEVKDIRDKAKAFEEYSRQAKNVEAERRACEIRLRAERKAGQLLRDMEKAKAGRPAKNPSNDARDLASPRTLRELGISYDQSSQWQQLADVPDEQFEAAFAGPDKPTTAGIIESAKPKSAAKPMDSRALWLWGRLRDFERETPPLLDDDPQRLLAPHRERADEGGARGPEESCALNGAGVLGPRSHATTDRRQARGETADHQSMAYAFRHGAGMRKGTRTPRRRYPRRHRPGHQGRGKGRGPRGGRD